jgi:hypothetical protein
LMTIHSDTYIAKSRRRADERAGPSSIVAIILM